MMSGLVVQYPLFFQTPQSAFLSAHGPQLPQLLEQLINRGLAAKVQYPCFAQPPQPGRSSTHLKPEKRGH